MFLSIFFFTFGPSQFFSLEINHFFNSWVAQLQFDYFSVKNFFLLFRFSGNTLCGTWVVSVMLAQQNRFSGPIFRPARSPSGCCG